MDTDIVEPYFLGVDPSATSTGISLIGKNSGYTTRIRPGKLRESERLQYIHERFKKIIGDNIVYLACVEAPSFKSTHKEFILGEVLGVIKLTLIQANIPTINVPPTQVKKYGCGKGRASKEQMISRAQELGCPVAQEDCCDSWIMGLLARDLCLGLEGSISKARASLEVIRDVRAKHDTVFSALGLP